MNRQTFGSLLILLAARAPDALAQAEEIPQLETTVVTATRSETPLRQVGSSVTVITAEDIARRQVVTVAEALRVVPGLDVLNSGGPGRQTSVFLRGGSSRHTLVLIDGVEMNDPSSPTNAFDFANLTVDNVERIEVLRGGESSIYGSDPLGGVINIVTKKGRDKPEYSITGQGGSFDTFRVGGSVAGGTDLADYSLASSRLETSGFSAADQRWGNPEPDGYRNSTVDGRLGVHPMENLDFGWNIRYTEAKTFLDYDYPNPTDALNYHGINKELFTRGFTHFKILDNLWEQTLGLAYSRTDRRNRNYDPALPFSLNSDYLGEKVKVDWQNILHLHEANTLTMGVDNEEDRLSSETDPIGAKSYNTQGYYLMDQLKLWDRSYTTAAVRYDENNRVGGKVTWRVTQALVLDETGTKLHGSYGTGFKVPSLFDLYDRFTGNPDLVPETSHNWDIGIEQVFWDRRIVLDSTYFNNRFDNLIQYSFTNFKVENISQARTEGVENAIQFNPLDNLSLRGNYTYTHAEDLTTGERLIRRPTHKGSFEANYRFLEDADINLTILMVGDKDDTGENQVPGYVLVNLAGGYRINDNIRLFARIDNLFDKNYQELYGYGTSRLAGYGGVALKF